MHQNKSYLWLFLTPLIAFLLVYSVALWKQKHPQEVAVAIGPFSGAAIRERVALKALSNLINEFPGAKIYRVNLKGTGPPKGYILFYRREPRFGPERGTIWFNYMHVDQAMMKRNPLAYQGTTDEAIRDHVRKSDRFEDVLRTKHPLKFLQ
jgi:hypothetical protein